jgi:hypothetical protein
LNSTFQFQPNVTIMKTTLLLTLLLNCFVSFGQEFLDSTKKWNDMVTMQATCNCGLHETHSYYLEGDSVINERDYKVLMDSTYHSPLDDAFIPEITIEKAGYIREDIAAEQIFFIAEGQEGETLIYDFKLDISASIAFEFETYTVTAIDSVEFLGIKRKVITLSSNEGDIQWISGIGTDKGLFYYSIYETLLLCVSDKNGLLYENEEGYDCIVYDTWSTIDENKANLFQLKPNPAYSSIIVSSSSEIKKLEIIDLIGKVIRTEYPQNNEIYIDLSGFNPGLYLVKIENGFQKLLVY